MSTYFKVFANFRKVMKFHGGIRGAYKTLYYTDTLKQGEFKGTDEFGNRYYENRKFFIGRSRWIEFTDKVGFDYDASQIPSDWRLWLQYTREETPLELPAVEKKWVMPFEENFTQSSKQYVPYSTAKPKVEAWKPPSS